MEFVLALMWNSSLSPSLLFWCFREHCVRSDPCFFLRKCSHHTTTLTFREALLNEDEYETALGSVQTAKTLGAPVSRYKPLLDLCTAELESKRSSSPYLRSVLWSVQVLKSLNMSSIVVWHAHLHAQGPGSSFYFLTLSPCFQMSTNY